MSARLRKRFREADWVEAERLARLATPHVSLRWEHETGYQLTVQSSIGADRVRWAGNIFIMRDEPQGLYGGYRSVTPPDRGAFGLFWESGTDLDLIDRFKEGSPHEGVEPTLTAAFFAARPALTLPL